MTRFAALTALALATLLLAVARAQPVPGLGGLTIVEAKAEKGKLTWTESVVVPVQKEVTVEVEMNGKKVTRKELVVVYETVSVTKEFELKGVKATVGAGKAIEAEKLTERLKDKTPVVILFGALPAKHRELFKDTTVFIEFPAPSPVPAPPVVVPAPVPPKKG